MRDRPSLLLFLLLALGFLFFLLLAHSPCGAGPPRPTELTPATGR
jgi:hypothetical protein